MVNFQQIRHLTLLEYTQFFYPASRHHIPQPTSNNLDVLLLTLKIISYFDYISSNHKSGVFGNVDITG
jgi:hypothetical protein